MLFIVSLTKMYTANETHSKKSSMKIQWSVKFVKTKYSQREAEGTAKRKKEEKQKTNMNVSIFNVKRSRRPPVDVSNK